MSQKPTAVRYLVLAVTAVMAVFMYIDRVCIAQVSADIQADLKMTQAEMDWVKSAFFWSYALSQVPAGVFGMRFGFRRMLALYLFLWSFFTAVSGMAGGFAALIGARLAVGVTEAGAYPNAASIIKGWFPVARRGFANSAVSLGGRLGGALGQLLTPILVALFAGAIIWNGNAMPGWRVVLVLFGIIGILWSFVFYCVVRDRPGLHPWANAAEAAMPETVTATTSASPGRMPLGVFLSSRTLWAFSMMQFFINLGWAFMITQFPDYLQTVHNKTGSEKGLLSSLPGFVGCVGMFAGGFLTDWLTRKLGLQRGRVLPIILGASGCASSFLFCVTADSAWAVVAALCIVTLGTDMAIPAIWAIAQDIGGQRVGPVLGWANMWGNFGAACCPLLLGWVQREFGWSAVFVTAAVSYGFALGLALLIDAEQPLEVAD
jgi:MFS family permease